MPTYMWIFDNFSRNCCFILTSYHLYARPLDYRAHAHHLDFLKYLKNKFPNKLRHLALTPKITHLGQFLNACSAVLVTWYALHWQTRSRLERRHRVTGWVPLSCACYQANGRPPGRARSRRPSWWGWSVTGALHCPVVAFGFRKREDAPHQRGPYSEQDSLKLLVCWYVQLNQTSSILLIITNLWAETPMSGTVLYVFPR